MSNTNKMGNEECYAEFEAWKEKKCVACFGININENHGNVFSVKLAEELLETGNKIYKENFGKFSDMRHTNTQKMQSRIIWHRCRMMYSMSW